MDHVEDFRTATGNGLGRNSDHIVENCHSALNKRLTRINYWIKNFESENHGYKLFRGIIHFNSYNL